MGQLGFFDLGRRYEALDRKKDPLVTLAAVVPWESFRCEIQAALARQDLRTPAAVGGGGNPRVDGAECS